MTILVTPFQMFLHAHIVGCRLWGRTESDMTSDLAAAAADVLYCIYVLAIYTNIFL